MALEQTIKPAAANRQEMLIRAVVVVALLYVFLVGVSLLESGIKSLGSDVQEQLFESVTNPLAGLFVGVLGTVLVQSSSVSTATIVGLVASGVISVDAAVPMVMGANIGTTVTNTLVSLGHVRQTREFERAFAAATVHDMFNVLAVAVLLPLELQTGFLSKAASRLTELFGGGSGATFESPIKEAVKEPVAWVTDLFEALGASGTALGVMLIVVALACIFLALTFVTKNMRQLIAQRVERSLNRMLGRSGGLVAMVLGLLVTIAVQSSSITTSILIPLAAAGILTLENVYPITLGANVGTTITALLAALATDSADALTIAFVHTLFNLTAIAIFYPIPFLRKIPIVMSRRLAALAVENRILAIGYVAGLFIFVPVVGILILR